MRALRLLALALLAAALPAAQELTFPLPATWVGSEDGSTAGNPFQEILGGGRSRPLWRLDRIWPPGPDGGGRNWSPMPWRARDQRWVPADRTRDGHPHARREADGALILTLATRWDADRNDNQGMKLPALVFIAPVPGVYAFRGTATATRLTGDGAVHLRLIRRETDRPDQRSRELARLDLPLGKGVALAGSRGFAVEVTAAGQELGLVPAATRDHTAAQVHFSGLAVVGR